MTLARLRLKKREDRRIRSGHPWIYSNEIDTQITPLKNFTAGQEVIVEANDSSLLGVGYINPNSLITVRMLTRDANEVIDEIYFLKRITTALTLRTQLFDKPFYRLVFAESDQLPGLVIDRFADNFVVQINTAGMEAKTNMIVNALQQLFPDIKSILLKNDSQIRVQENLSVKVEKAFGEVPDEVMLEENGVPFIAPLMNGQKTGWFYDHRPNRARLRQYVQDKRVLDVFSYAGSFGIQAAVYGASQVSCIEVSAEACAFIKRNAELNHVADKVTIISDDAFDAMKKLVQEKQSFDVIILDPPAFVKKLKDKKEGLIAYQRLNELALKLLSANGVLFSCSCSMHISMQDICDLLKRAAYNTQTTIQILERGHQGADHPVHIAVPETDYLKAMVVRKI